MPIKELDRKGGFSDTTFYNLRAMFGGIICRSAAPSAFWGSSAAVPLPPQAAQMTKDLTGSLRSPIASGQAVKLR